MVRRFSATERALHWIHAVAFFGMLVTGVALYLPALAGGVGSRQDLKAVHLVVAVGWVVALLLVAALGNRRALRATALELDLFDDDDRRWLRGAAAPQARFNAGQKLHSVVQAAAAVLFVVSGVLLLAGERDTRLRLDGTILLHDALTVGATALVAGHLYLALVHPPTRPALRGMLGGRVDAAWAASHHAKWRPGPLAPTPGPAPLRRPLTWVLLALALAVALGSVVLASGSLPGLG